MPLRRGTHLAAGFVWMTLMLAFVLLVRWLAL
jgi:hypothetical protein